MPTTSNKCGLHIRSLIWWCTSKSHSKCTQVFKYMIVQSLYLFGFWSQTGSLTASPDYWDQKVDLCHFALRNLSCCHWSDLWDNLKYIFIYIYLNTIEHKQKSLKSAFIWRHLNIMVHKQNSLKSIYMMAQSLTRNLSGYALHTGSRWQCPN